MWGVLVCWGMCLRDVGACMLAGLSRALLKVVRSRAARFHDACLRQVCWHKSACATPDQAADSFGDRPSPPVPDSQLPTCKAKTLAQ